MAWHKEACKDCGGAFRTTYRGKHPLCARCRPSAQRALSKSSQGWLSGEALLRARFHAMGLFSKCTEGASCVRPKGGGRVRALWAAIMSALKILPGACARGTAPQRSHLCVRKPMDDQMVY